MFYYIRFQNVIWKKISEKDLGENICILIETKKRNAFKNWNCTMKFQVLTWLGNGWDLEGLSVHEKIKDFFFLFLKSPIIKVWF